MWFINEKKEKFEKNAAITISNLEPETYYEFRVLLYVENSDKTNENSGAIAVATTTCLGNVKNTLFIIILIDNLNCRKRICNKLNW